MVLGQLSEAAKSSHAESVGAARHDARARLQG